jgi:chemotaxis protein methyltransferase CheR
MIFPEEFKNKFKDFISSRCGLYFKDHDMKNLKDAIFSRMKSCGFDSVPGYYLYVTTSGKKEDEFRELLNLLTIQHTYFFRNEPQFKALREKVLPEIVARKKAEGRDKPGMRIWSAGCSTGEEPYSIAIAIRDVIENPEEWSIEIYATDASTYALEKARNGVYGGNSMRLVNKDCMNKYFIEKTGDKRNRKYRIRDEIKNMVHFDYFNLMDEGFPGGFDIIFCRNVVIYFELETTIRVMDKLHPALTDQGYLFIGYSESLQFISDRFRMEDWEDSIFYRKAPRVALPKTEIPKTPLEKLDEILEEISKAEVTAEKEAKKKESPLPATMEDILVRTTKAMHLKLYDRALSLIGEAQAIDRKAVEPYYLTAEIYTNQRRFNDAKKKLEFALKLDTLFAPAHYLSGSIYAEEENLEEAERSLKRALYLDKNFSLAYFSLGALYKRKGRTAEAIRAYRNTLKTLSPHSSDDILAYSGGFNAATLMNVCKNNIERLKREE